MATSTIPGIKRGSTAPALAVQLTAADAPLDLAGYTAVQLKIRDASGAIVVDAAMTIDDAANGRVSYAWGATDLAAAGLRELEFWLTDGAGLVRKHPDIGYVPLSVTPDLSPAA